MWIYIYIIYIHEFFTRDHSQLAPPSKRLSCLLQVPLLCVHVDVLDLGIQQGPQGKRRQGRQGWTLQTKVQLPIKTGVKCGFQAFKIEMIHHLLPNDRDVWIVGRDFPIIPMKWGKIEVDMNVFVHVFWRVRNSCRWRLPLMEFV